MTSTTGRRGRTIRRSTVVLTGLALLAPLAINQTLSAGAAESRALGHALTAAPAGATSSLVTPAEARRTRLAAVTLPTDTMAVGDRLTWNLFGDVTLAGTVTEHDESTFEGAATRLWTGTLSDGGTFELSQYQDAQRLAVHSASGEFLVLHDTDETAGLVVELKKQAPRVTDHGPQGGDRAALPDPAAQAPAPVGVSELDADLEADVPGGRARRAAAAPQMTPPVLWSTQHGAMSLARWFATPYVVPVGGPATYVDEWIQITDDLFVNSYASNEAQVIAMATTQVGRINATLANSRISTRVRLGRVSVSNTPQRADLRAEYLGISNPADGYLDWVPAQRRSKRMDHITQIIRRPTSDQSLCGLGTLGGSDRNSLTTMYYDCLDGRDHLTYAHEFGHNFSAQHDRGASQAPTPNNAYAYGYVDPAKRFRTIMSYPDTCPAPNCAWLPMFSSPGLRYTGLPTGNATTDNRRAVINWAPTLANTAPDRIHPGEVRVAGSSRMLHAYSGAWLPWSTTVSYTWYVGGRVVSRSPYYRPTNKMNGKAIKVVATGSAPGYPSVTTTSKTWKLLRVKGTSFRGRAKVGQTLRIVPGRKAAKKQKVTVVWKRGTTVVGRKLSYRLKRKDAGANIHAFVTYRAKGRMPDTYAVRWGRTWR